MTTLEQQQRRGMRLAIVSQCLGFTSILALQNNLLLLYLASRGVSSSRIVVYLALPLIFDVAFRLPTAYLADHFGKKRVSLTGQAAAALGYLLIMAAGWTPQPWPEGVVVLGLCLFGAGHGTFASSWYALLQPVVPESRRGSFFGRVQYTSQTVGIVGAAIWALFLGQDSPVWHYQVILAVIALGMLLRMATYSGIPELETSGAHQENLRDTVKGILHNDAFISFCAYFFLITMFTAACPAFFGLVQKRVLDLGDGQVAWLGNLLVIGALLGYFLGGRLIDRYGTRPVFLLGHLAFAVTILGFVLRELIPAPPLYTAGLFVFLFGVTQAATAIAFTAEMLALVPANGKSLSTSVAMVLSRGGIGLMGVLSAWILDSGLLSERWQLGGLTLSVYDSVLMGFGVMVLLLSVTVALVPSVRGKYRWAPDA